MYSSWYYGANTSCISVLCLNCFIFCISFCRNTILLMIMLLYCFFHSPLSSHVTQLTTHVTILLESCCVVTSHSQTLPFQLVPFTHLVLILCDGGCLIQPPDNNRVAHSEEIQSELKCLIHSLGLKVLRNWFGYWQLR